ncbi:hypothetical protein LSTR_LSTR007629 [Laodelphax striatellus]|uniref:Uncharacterized protein n=1 Tax=Laodelphax striatellus TaxID=195883 RepID=A0A482WIE4_LAOST|nr:hypothetical protein LSTR_LSTR007629 [Laodelphax striatellus]
MAEPPGTWELRRSNRPTKNYRAESYAAIIDCGISAGEIQNHPHNTGLNFDLLRRTSEVLSSLSTFKMTTISFPSLSEYGVTAQIAMFQPEPDQPGVRNIQGLTTIQTINEELHSHKTIQNTIGTVL